jgi:CubicO group peptidase (beta-lactamase class C family)
MNQRREFVRQIGLLSVAGILPHQTFAKSKNGLPRSTPEAQGVSTEAIHKYFNAIEKSGEEFHATTVVKNGFIIAEAYWHPYRPDHKMQLYSMSKSFTSTAVGFAQQDGLLTVEEQVIKYFPNDLPTVISDNLQKLKIKHLLMMSVGMAKDSIMTIEVTQNWAKTFLSLPIEFEPGTKFLYNSGASFMLSAIVQKVTGKTTQQYLQEKLYKHIGIENTTWSETPEGINFGASHLRLTHEDFVKFGQFYLQKGKWNGKQLLDPAYIAAASSKQINNGNNNSSWAYGYGYQFWMNPVGGFRADGAFGQYDMIFPDINAQVAISSESMLKEVTMKLVWEGLYPELAKSKPLTANKIANNKLKERLKELNIDTSKGTLTGTNINGKIYEFESNDLGVKKIHFTETSKNLTFKIEEENQKPYSIQCGKNRWYTGKNYKPTAHSLFSRRRIDFDSQVAASSHWENTNTLHIALRLIETVHTDYLKCEFVNNTLTISPLFSVQKREGKADSRNPIIGKMI